MPAYIVGQVAVHDLAEYNKYLAGFPEAFAPFEGRVLVASDQVETIEGVSPKARTVVSFRQSTTRGGGTTRQPTRRSPNTASGPRRRTSF